MSNETAPDPGADRPLLELAAQDPPEAVVALIGTYFEAARLLGQRTGELHLALASDTDNRDFAPEFLHAVLSKSPVSIRCAT